MQNAKIIDADGHINDHACGEEIATYMPKGNQMAKLFPELDHLHFRYLKQNRHQLDGALSYRRISGGTNHGGGVGHRRLQSV